MRSLSFVFLLLFVLLATGCGDDRRRGGPSPFADVRWDAGMAEADGATSTTGPPSHCSDGRRSGDETHADCGGSCRQCPDGAHCEAPADCVSGVCRMGFCLVASCMDGVQNAMEVGVDCGGGACDACPGGTACTADEQCLSGMCTSGSCTESSCEDGLLNADEADVDCGGSCPACDGGASCSADDDCVSNICSASTCTVPSCSDSTRNQDETDVDCGGSACAPCLDGRGCGTPADCGSGVCEGGRCISCDDGVRNGTETDVDCGGADCGACEDGSACSTANDCASLVCTSGTCIGPTCTDGIRNQDESDVDCGGTVCDGCSDGGSCDTAVDCDSGVCASGLCAAPTCSDAVQNGGEADVDCGGATSCPRCADYRTCVGPSDCATAACTSGRCGSTGCAWVATDAAGYTGCAVPGATTPPCADISATGTGVTLGNDSEVTVPLGFSFDFYGTPYTSVYASADGALVFDSSFISFSNACLPRTSSPLQFIAAFWDDLNTGSAAWYTTTGAAPNRRFTFMWRGPHYYAAGTDTVDIRVVLHETTNDIEVCYVDTTVGSASYDLGASATAGIQGASGDAIQYSCNAAGIAPGTVIRYSAP